MSTGIAAGAQSKVFSETIFLISQAAFWTAALVIGGTPEAKAAAQMLTARGLSMPISAIESEAHPGRFLGYSATPYLLVLDRHDRVRIVVPGPTSNAELRAFHRAAEGLLEPTPLTR